MKATRNTAAVVFVIVSLTILGLSYATSAGRRAARQAVRTARIIGNATQIYPQPALMLRISGRESAEPEFRVRVYETGRLVVTSRGSVERQVSRETANMLVETGKAAVGDFNEGCNMETDGVKAELYLLIDGRWTGSTCRDSLTWPQGTETRRLLREISSQLPPTVKAPITF